MRARLKGSEMRRKGVVRHGGRDFRLTDVSGHVVQQIIV
ncbi:MAG: hypothetical protein ACI8XO_003448 [Verrucomicrobiales bacterium]